MDKKIDRVELETYLKTCSPDNTRIFLGADSKRLKKRGIWYADYYTVIVVADKDQYGRARNHVFYQAYRDRDYDTRKNKPTTRLINEIYSLCSVYKEFEDLLENYDQIEMHMDINSVESAGSNHVLSQAVGIVRGMCGIDPKCKPDAWAASFAADRASEFDDRIAAAKRGLAA